MAYPPGMLGFWQEIRDTINFSDQSTASYPQGIDGILHNIRDLLNVSLLGTTVYPNTRLGILQNIRDLLNTGHESTAAYSADVLGVLQNIRDLLNADDASVASYPPGQYGLLQAARDFIVASGWPVGEGGGGGYTAQAVHFDGSTFLENETFDLTGLDLKKVAYSIWLRVANIADNSYAGIITSDPEGAYSPNYAIEVDGAVNTVYCAAAPGVNGLIVATNETGFPPPTNEIVIETWLNILINMDTSLDAAGMVAQMYVNDVVPADVDIQPDGVAFDQFENLKELIVGGDYFDSNLIADVAEVWIGVGQSIDFSVETNRRKFIDANGKPVDLGSDGSTPTGVAPPAFFKRDGAASTFATNRGTGGAFTLEGLLTNASTSPSD